MLRDASALLILLRQSALMLRCRLIVKVHHAADDAATPPPLIRLALPPRHEIYASALRYAAVIRLRH